MSQRKATPKRRTSSRSRPAESPVDFRNGLEQDLAPYLQKWRDSTRAFVRKMIDLLCAAYERGGIEEASRVMDEIDTRLFGGPEKVQAAGAREAMRK